MSFGDVRHDESGKDHREVSSSRLHDFVLPTHVPLCSQEGGGVKMDALDFVNMRNEDLNITLVVVSSASCVIPHALTRVIGWSVLRCDFRLRHLHPSSIAERPERR